MYRLMFLTWVLFSKEAMLPYHEILAGEFRVIWIVVYKLIILEPYSAIRVEQHSHGLRRSPKDVPVLIL